jgi:hypothetical protein
MDIEPNARNRRMFCIFSPVLALAYILGWFWFGFRSKDALDFWIRNITRSEMNKFCLDSEDSVLCFKKLKFSNSTLNKTIEWSNARGFVEETSLSKTVFKIFL